MDFNFTSEQKQLADSLKKYISKEWGLEQRRKMARFGVAESEKLWGGLVNLGLTALPIAEQYNGLSGTHIDMFVVMQECGRGLVSGAYFWTMLGAHLLGRCSNEGQKENLLPKVAEGTCKIAVALFEKDSRYDLAHVQARATEKDRRIMLSGNKSFVYSGASADYFVVSVKTESDRIGLFLVPKNAKGLSFHNYRTIDGDHAGELHLDNVEVTQEHALETNKALSVMRSMFDYANMLLCAESVGAMDEMCKQTVEYTKTRKQFDQPIGKFQVLQHRMVDMFIHLEQARSMAYLACVKISEEDTAERRRLISAARVRIIKASKFIAQNALQTYGGMGMSDEVALSHYFKRLTGNEFVFGDGDFHLEQFMDASAN